MDASESPASMNSHEEESAIRRGSDPSFCPPVEEGVCYDFEDEAGNALTLEFLGLLLYEGARFGFFFVVDDDTPALSSGEVIVLEVTELDADGQPESFELVDDDALALELYNAFKHATRAIYRFE